MPPQSSAPQIKREEFETRLKASGIKLTHQRLEIFKEVAKTIDHPDAETIYRKVNRRIPSISLDTVYRTLWLLRDLGLIKTVCHFGERVRFDGNTKHHHHFICTGCGLIRDFESETFNTLPVPRQVKAFGKVESRHIEFRGKCQDCATI